MQKKLLAVAVAGALGAPAVALAQNATVNVYGRFYAEYSRIDQGRAGPQIAGPNGVPAPVLGGELVTYDHLQNPGSAIGFRGEEKISSGLSAWFQCESTADWRGQSNEGFCSRNSALGLKGHFGNFFMGVWDTPFKRVMDAVGGNDTGVYGTAFLLTGNSTTVNSGAASQGVFRRRQRNSINYDTPNFGGFQVSGAFSTLNTQSSTLNTATGNKPRIWSLSAKYSNGPINVFAAYEKHKDVTGATGAGDDKGWVLGANYTFPFRLKVGGQYTEQKWQYAAGAGLNENKVKAWHLGIDWNISGPHGIRAAYTQAGDVKGPLAGAGALGGGTTRPAANPDSKGKLWQIRYVHALSKRTEATVGYSKLDNSRNSAYNLGGVVSNALGQDQNAWAISLDHRF